MTKNTTDTMETVANEAYEKSKDFMTKGISTSEKMADSLIELNAAIFKGSEAIGKKMYENYVSNIAAGFESVKALNKASDMAEFYKIASSNLTSAAERVNDQSKSVVELSGKVMKDTGEAARLAYTKGFSVSG